MKQLAHLVLLLPFLAAIKTVPAKEKAPLVPTGKDYAVFSYVTDYDDRRWPPFPNTETAGESLANELHLQSSFAYGFVCNPNNAANKACPAPEQVSNHDSLILVQGGTFTMGSPSHEVDRGDDETQHTVTLSDFYIGQYEVTQQFWTQVMGSNPSHFKDCDQCPVEQVSWEDVQIFLKKLNATLPADQKPYRLPTEAEWEYAARGGGQAVLFGNGKNIIDPSEINFDGSAAYKEPYSVAGAERQKTVPVGSLNSPNALGLHDMSGNVWEWCSDWYGLYPSGSQTNPTGPASGSLRIQRGGSWLHYPQACRVAYRFGRKPDARDHIIGFRIARSK